MSVFLASGYAIGHAATLGLTKFIHYEQGSPEEKLMLEALAREVDALPVITTMLSGEGSEWEEVVLEAHEGNMVINEKLPGFMGLTLNRAFWNKKTEEFVMTVWYGGALSGWPGIAHGGSTATVLLEGMGRAMNCATEAGQATKPPDPSQLGLTYLKPVRAGNLYLLKATFSPEEPTPATDIDSERDLAKKLHKQKEGITSRLNKKFEINCTIETLGGMACAKAKGVWNIV